MHRFVPFVVLAIAAFTASASANTVTAFLTEQTNSDPASNAVGVELTIADTTGGVQVTATVRDIPTLILGEGDILAIWFDIAAAVNLASVTYSAPFDPANLNITGFVKGHNTVGSAPFGGNPNINGMPSPFSAATPYDIAIRLGTNGMAADFYPSASFKLTNVTAADFSSSGNRFAARVTSIGPDNQASGKYAGYPGVNPGPGPNPVPLPTAAGSGLALIAALAIRRKRIEEI